MFNVDKLTKSVLKEIVSQFNEKEKPIKITYLKNKFKTRREKMLVICNYLEHIKKIEYQYYPDFDEKEYVIPNLKELHPFIYKAEHIGDYLKEKWIDILSFFISLVSFILSIIAIKK